MTGPGYWTRPAHHSFPARLQEHRRRVGGRDGRSHSSGEGRSEKKSPRGNGALQQLSHTPFRLRQLSRRSGFSHSGARFHGGRHLNYPPSLRLFPFFSLTSSPQEPPETVERLRRRGWKPRSPAALTTCRGAPAHKLEREALGAAILSRLSLLPSSVVALPRRKWRSPGPVPTPPSTLHWPASGAGGKAPQAPRLSQPRRRSNHNCGSRHLETVPLPRPALSAAATPETASTVLRNRGAPEASGTNSNSQGLVRGLRRTACEISNLSP